MLVATTSPVESFATFSYCVGIEIKLEPPFPFPPPVKFTSWFNSFVPLRRVRIVLAH